MVRGDSFQSFDRRDLWHETPGSHANGKASSHHDLMMLGECGEMNPFVESPGIALCNTASPLWFSGIRFLDTLSRIDEREDFSSGLCAFFQKFISLIINLLAMAPKNISRPFLMGTHSWTCQIKLATNLSPTFNQYQK